MSVGERVDRDRVGLRGIKRRIEVVELLQSAQLGGQIAARFRSAAEPRRLFQTHPLNDMLVRATPPILPQPTNEHACRIAHKKSP